MPGGWKVTILPKDVREVHEPNGVPGVMAHGLAVGGARGGSIAARERQRAQLIERVEIRRIRAKHLHVGELRPFIVAAPRERASALQCFRRTHRCRPGAWNLVS